MKPKILIVDGDETARRLTREVLGEKNYAYLEAGSGEEALEILKSRQQVSLILTDYMMPGMNGIELSDCKKRLPDRKDIPVVILTTLRSKALIEHAAVKGVLS